MDLRPAELAGRWYPGTADECDRMLDGFSKPEQQPQNQPYAAIAPHAGWVYSGAVAYRALLGLHAKNEDADLLVLFGGHLGKRDAARVLIEGGFETPYGTMPIAAALAADVSMAVMAEPETPDEYYDDNAIEVLVPMLKKLWPQAQLLTVGVPPTPDAADVGRQVIELARVRGFKKIAVVGSTDLTHYGPNYRYNPHGRGRPGWEWVTSKNDPEMIAQIQTMDPGKVLWMAERQRNACCPGAVGAAIGAAKKLGAKSAALTDYTTSYDVRPSEPEPMSFVGYAGMLLTD